MPDTSKLEKLNRELEKSEKKLRKAINDEKLTQIALEKLQKKIEGIYLEIDAEPYGENFKEKSFEKASFAELTAQVDGCGADYFVYTELQPITKETHFNFIYSPPHIHGFHGNLSDATTW